MANRSIYAVILDALMNWPFRIISSVKDKFLIEWVHVAVQYLWTCTNIGLILLVFGLTYGLAQIQHRFVQYPVILDGYTCNNKIIIYMS